MIKNKYLLKSTLGNNNLKSFLQTRMSYFGDNTPTTKCSKKPRSGPEFIRIQYFSEVRRYCKRKGGAADFYGFFNWGGAARTWAGSEEAFLNQFRLKNNQKTS